MTKKIDASFFTPDIIEMFNRAFANGNPVEVKEVRGNIVFVEIQRKVKKKTSVTG